MLTTEEEIESEMINLRTKNVI